MAGASHRIDAQPNVTIQAGLFVLVMKRSALGIKAEYLPRRIPPKKCTFPFTLFSNVMSLGS